MMLILNVATGLSFFVCSVLTLSLLAIDSSEAVIGFEAAFNAVFAVGLAALTVASTEACPTSIRSYIHHNPINELVLL